MYWVKNVGVLMYWVKNVGVLIYWVRNVCSRVSSQECWCVSILSQECMFTCTKSRMLLCWYIESRIYVHVFRVENVRVENVSTTRESCSCSNGSMQLFETICVAHRLKFLYSAQSSLVAPWASYIVRSQPCGPERIQWSAASGVGCVRLSDKSYSTSSWVRCSLKVKSTSVYFGSVSV